MANKVIKVVQDCWWDSNGCSCCEATCMEYFTSEELSYTPSNEVYVYIDLLEKYDSTWDEVEEERFEELGDDHNLSYEKGLNILVERLLSVGVEVEFEYLEDE